MIKFENVSKKYNDTKFLIDDVSFEIEEGEFVFLVGPSGAGKTTLLKLLTREDVPTTGKVSVDEKDIADLTKKEMPILRRNIGMVFQDFKLLETRTVFENVAISMEVAGKSTAEINEVVPRLLKLVGIEDKGHQYPAEIAGGEKQRVSLARALAHDPKYLVADEPTGNIDPLQTWEVVKIFQAINEYGTTILFATHDKTVVDELKKRVIKIEDGKITKDEKNSTYD